MQIAIATSRDALRWSHEGAMRILLQQSDVRLHILVRTVWRFKRQSGEIAQKKLRKTPQIAVDVGPATVVSKRLDCGGHPSAFVVTRFRTCDGRLPPAVGAVDRVNWWARRARSAVICLARARGASASLGVVRATAAAGEPKGPPGGVRARRVLTHTDESRPGMVRTSQSDRAGVQRVGFMAVQRRFGFYRHRSVPGCSGLQEAL